MKNEYCIGCGIRKNLKRYDSAYCVKCGARKNLKRYGLVYFRISKKSNPNLMEFKDCYVCEKCEKLAIKVTK